jgi:hypothetical protein
MSLYKDSGNLRQSSDGVFDQINPPGARTPRSGIYLCTGCGHEIVSTEGHPLPPQNHHQHVNSTPIRWKLIVYADHRHWQNH